MSDIVERLRWRAENTNTPTATTPMLCAEAADTITALRAEVEQHQRSFDLRWDASMRAIERWQEVNPGNDLNWPDHADLVVWLLERDAALRAENERLKVESIQMQAALGYGILAEDERHIIPSNPFKCGTCDANKHLRAENEKLRAALEGYACTCTGGECAEQAGYRDECGKPARAALEEKQ